MMNAAVKVAWSAARRAGPSPHGGATRLRDRGLDTTRPIFIGIDGGKAPRAAAVRIFDHPTTGRSHIHRSRNVADNVPDHLTSTVGKRMRAPSLAESAILVEAQLEAFAKELDRTHPGAATSLRERLSETLTVLRLGLSPTLDDRCTAALKRWRAAGMIKAGRQFRRVNGRLHLPALRAALDACRRRTCRRPAP